MVFRCRASACQAIVMPAKPTSTETTTPRPKRRRRGGAGPISLRAPRGRLAGPGSARRPASAPGRRPAPRPRRSAARGSFSRHFRQIVSRSRSTRGIEPARRGRLLLQHLQQRVQRRLAAERRPAGQQLVEDRPQAVDVGGGGQRPFRAGGLLGGHVAGRADDGARAASGSLSPLDALGQAEVGDVRLALGVEQDVGRLEVAVQDAALVGVVDRPGHRRQQPRPPARVPGQTRQMLRPGCRPRSASC